MPKNFTTFAPWDQDEDDPQRKAALAPDDDEDPVGASAIMQPDTEDETEDASPASSSTPQMSPSMAKYAQLLSQAPNHADYKPSIWRRIGAGLAGAGAGWRNPAQGVEIAQKLISQPYDAAMQRWQQSLGAAQGQMGLDEKLTQRGIAQQRASAYAQSAQARMKAADATEKFRQYQQAHMPWQPQNEEEAERLNQSKINPRNPTAFEQYSDDPVGYAKFIKDTEKPSTALTLDDRMKLQSSSEAAASSRQAAHDNRMIAARRDPANKPPKQPSMVDTMRAEQMAIEQAVRENPEFEQFVLRQTDKAGRPLDPQIISADDAQNVGTHWFNRDAQKQSMNRDQYRQFLSDVDKRKKALLNSTSGQSQWTIQPEEEEDQ